MPQKTNLNIAPYYDDFDEDKNYYRVLFKPGKSIQARELTTLQSILQNQIEKFGRHFFKDGDVVIPGAIGYDSEYTCIEIDSIHLGIPVTDYLTSLIGKTIKGEVSNVTAKIENVIDENQSERKNNTLYIKYISSSLADFTAKTFQDGENLIIQEDVVYPTGVLRQDTSVATTISNNCNSIGSSVKINNGVYFARGFFLRVQKEVLILDQYNNTPSYRVGLLIKESFASASNEFSDLLDNSQGFYNFASSGADRLLIETELYKKPLDDFDDQNFIQLLKIEDGVLTIVNEDSPEKNRLLKELAKRTYDESGDYYVEPFDIDLKESLNDYIGSKGVYDRNDITINGNTPSDNLACITIGPGKAYVRGYEIENTRTKVIDVLKPRTTEAFENRVVPFNFGTQIELNNVYGTIPLGLTEESYLKFYNRRTDQVGVATGKQIGIARLYDLKLKSAGYTDESSIFEASLYDVQTYTTIRISSGFSTSYLKSSYIEGKFSGANGYLVDNITTSIKEFDIFQVSGQFVNNEPIIVNGDETNRVIKKVVDYTLNDVYQVTSYETTPTATFTADTILSKKDNYSNNEATYTISARTDNSLTGISTITTANQLFIKKIKVGDVIKYSNPSLDLPVYNVIKEVKEDSVIISKLSSVTKVNKGTLPETTLTVQNLKKVSPDVIKKDSKLFAPIGNEYVSSVNLSNSNITLRKTEVIENITNKSSFEVSIFEGASDSVLVSFDEEAYTLSYEDGTIEPLTSQKLLPNLDSSNNLVQGRITLRNLSKTGKAYLTFTYVKTKCKPRNKVYNRGTVVTINRTGVKKNVEGTGLIYTDVYGVRVEDKVISLGYPEVTNILGIFESSDENFPKTPRITMSSINGNINDLIKGENVLGENSKAVGVVLGNDGITNFSFCYLNSRFFEVGETITFQESGVSAVVSSIFLGSKNITELYKLDDGIRDSYYDFSRIIRKDTAEPPTTKIRIVFNHYTIESEDSGTFVTVDSYNKELYSKTPVVDKVRSSDILDFRPRVASYQIGISPYSPFDFRAREFNDANSSSTSIVAKDTSIFLDYEYYLPRIDKLFLDKNGEFNLINGIPSLTPREPDELKKALEVATFYYPPYTSKLSDVDIDIEVHKRYTMKDISLLEDRLEKVEYYTSLSLLENETKNLEIIDKNINLERFKSGFFVDNFTTVDGGNISNPLFRANIDTKTEVLVPMTHDEFVDLDLDITSADNKNIRVTGNSVLLDYSNKKYLENKFATKSDPVNTFNQVKWTNGNIKLKPSSDPWAELNAPEVYQFGSNSNEDSNHSLAGLGVDTELIATLRSDSNELILNDEDDKVGKIKSSGKDKDSSKNKKNEGENKKNEGKNKKLQRKIKKIKARTRNIGIYADSLKPYTKFYAFLDSQDVTNLVTPKLIEIEMQEGQFYIGDTVKGKKNGKFAAFKLKAPNDEYESNPYDKDNSKLPNDYTTTSTILNIDIEGLSKKTINNQYGCITEGMILSNRYGSALVKKVRLVTDESGSFIGSLFIPDPTDKETETFTVGKKVFSLSTNKSDSSKLEKNDSYAEAKFKVAGRSTRRDNSKEKDGSEQAATNNIEKRDSIIINQLSQTFTVKEKSGVYITECDIFFQSKSKDKIPVTLDIRSVENGFPSQNIIPLSSITLKPKDVNISEDASIATNFKFESPIFLEGESSDYCLVLTANSDEYSVWTSRVGEKDLSTGIRNFVNKQPDGYLFKSQSGSNWIRSDIEDLKYTLYRAKFTENSGSVVFYNPGEYSVFKNVDQVKKISKESIKAFSRSVRLNLNSSLTSNQINTLLSGKLLTQESNSSFSSKVINVEGSLALNYKLEIENPGIGFTSGVKNYTNVDLINTTGNGIGGQITLGVGTGVAYSATITNGGSGYSIGDVLTVDSRDTEKLGSNVVLVIQDVVGIITGSRTLILDDVQGTTNTSGDLIIGTETLTGIKPQVGGESVIRDGLHLKINAKNHGMYSRDCKVIISDVQPDTAFTKVDVKVTKNQTDPILVEDASLFSTFEGDAVSPSNIGYVKINDEIIGYSGIDTTTSPNKIFISSNGRGIDDTDTTAHYIDDIVFKYEFNGVSLRKINKEHSLSSANVNYVNDIDNFYIKVDGDDYFVKSKASSSYVQSNGKLNSPRISHNILYNKLRLVTDIETPDKTSVSAKCRTFSATSVDGNEVPYENKGYEDCSLVSDNIFNTPRAIYSKTNEQTYIQQSNKNSFLLKLELNTDNDNVSPIIDLDRVGVVATYNRINDPIDDWTKDSRVNSIEDDPNAAIYVSKKINLDTPADSLKVLFEAHRYNSNQIRVAYRLFREDVPYKYEVYELFPGFKNLDETGNVIEEENNDGTTDNKILSSESETDFKEYEYNVTKPYTFNGFQVKVIMTGTNQAKVPRIKNLRVIATR